MSKIVKHISYFPTGLTPYIPSVPELIDLMSNYFGSELILGPTGKDGSFGVLWEGRQVTFSGYFLVSTDSGDKYIDMNVDVVSVIRNNSINSIIQ